MKRQDTFGDSDPVNDQPITCERVDQEDLDRRYLLGQLPEPVASAFEAHYFGCEHCWALVKGGAQVRAARPGDRVTPASARRRGWMPLAVAAGLLLATVITWQVLAPRRDLPDEVRGGTDSLTARAASVNGAWRLSWPAVAGATAYRVRISAGDGTPRFSRELTDTVVVIPRDSLGPAGGVDTTYFELEAFDQLRRPLARSPLLPLPPE